MFYKTLFFLFFAFGNANHYIPNHVVFDNSFSFEKGLAFALKKHVYLTSENLELETSIYVDRMFFLAPVDIHSFFDLSEVQQHCLFGLDMREKKPDVWCSDTLRVDDLRLKEKEILLLLQKLEAYTWYTKEELIKQNLLNLYTIDDSPPKLHPNWTIPTVTKLQQQMNHYKKIQVTDNGVYFAPSDITVNVHKYLLKVFEVRDFRPQFLKTNNYTAVELIKHQYAYVALDNLGLMDNYISLIRQVLEVIGSGINSMMHPQMLSLSYIQKAAERWEQINSDSSKKLIIPAKDMKFTTVHEVSSFTYKYMNGTLKFVLRLPIVEKDKFLLYQVFPYPMQQNIGKNLLTVMAYIQPRIDYLLLAPNKTFYTPLYVRDLNLCKIVRDVFVCPSTSFIFSDYSEHRNCEISLLLGPQDINIDIFADCDVKIIQNQYSFWQNIQEKGAWLYSLPFPEVFNITCLSDKFIYRRLVTLKGAGILYLDGSCTARSQNGPLMTLSGYTGQRVTAAIGARESLNISKLCPAINEFEIFLDTATSTPVLLHRHPHILQYDYSLNELMNIIREKNELQKIQHSVQQIEIATICVLLLTICISIFYIFPEAIFAILSWIKYHLCPCREENGAVMDRDVLYERATSEVFISDPTTSSRSVNQVEPIASTEPIDEPESTEYIEMTLNKLKRMIGDDDAKPPSIPVPPLPPPLPLIATEKWYTTKMRQAYGLTPIREAPPTPISPPGLEKTSTLK